MSVPEPDIVTTHPDWWTELDTQGGRHRPAAGRRRGAEGRQRPPGHRDEPGARSRTCCSRRSCGTTRPTRTGSAGTGSCCPTGTPSLTLYIQLYLSGYGLELDDLQALRQLGLADARAPGARPHRSASRPPPARSARASATRSGWRWPPAASAACSTRTPRPASRPFDHHDLRDRRRRLPGGGRLRRGVHASPDTSSSAT